jgi:hypothetical protein
LEEIGGGEEKNSKKHGEVSFALSSWFLPFIYFFLNRKK